jgi:hypothetical protein
MSYWIGHEDIEPSMGEVLQQVITCWDDQNLWQLSAHPDTDGLHSKRKAEAFRRELIKLVRAQYDERSFCDQEKRCNHQL